MFNRRWLLAVPAGALLIFSLAQAQDAQPGQGRGGRRGDPGQFRERRINDVKDQLAPNEDEWKVLKPKIEKVMDAQRESFGGFGMFGRGGRDRGNDQAPPPSDRPESKVAKATRDLRTTLENKSASADELKAKLKAVREAREKARADVQAAQKELKEVCTQRQEAVLVLNGVIE